MILTFKDWITSKRDIIETKYKQSISYIYLIMGSLALTLMISLIKVLNEMPTFQLGFYQSISMLITSSCFTKIFKIPLYIKNKPTITKILIIISLLRAIATVLLLFSLQALATCDSILITFISPIITTLLAKLFLQENYDNTELIICCASFLGLILILQPHILVTSEYEYADEFDPKIEAGLCSLLATSIISIIYINFGEVTDHVCYEVILHYSSFFTVVICAICNLFEKIQNIGLTELVQLILIGLMRYIWQLSYHRAITIGEPGKIAVTSYIQILFCLIVGICFMDEYPTPLMFLGAFLIFSSMYSLLKDSDPLMLTLRKAQAMEK